MKLNKSYPVEKGDLCVIVLIVILTSRVANP